MMKLPEDLYVHKRLGQVLLKVGSLGQGTVRNASRAMGHSLLQR